MRAWSVNCEGAVLISSLTISGSKRTRCESGVTAGPCRAEDLARVGVEEVHPDLGQHAERADVDRLQLVGRQELRRAHVHPRLGPRRLLRSGVAGMAFTTAAPTTSEPFARGRVHVRHAGLPRVVPGPAAPAQVITDPTLAGTPAVGRVGRRHP